MSPIILADIEKLIYQQKVLDETLINPILEFFSHYKEGMFIYPGVLRRKFSMNIADVYSLLSTMEKKGILTKYYELYCGQCSKSMGTVLTFSELPDTFECELCHTELHTLENTAIVFKVVRDA